MDHRDPANARSIIRAFAYKISRRLYAVGDHTTSVDDIEQELWIGWCVAVESFDPERGIPFHAYLRNGLKLYANRWLEKNGSRRFDEINALRLDKTTSEDGAELHEAIASASPAPDEECERQSSVNAFKRRLSPTARKFVEILFDPPPELEREVKCGVAWAAKAKELGHIVSAPRCVTKRMIFDLMGLSQPARHKVISEIEGKLKNFAKVA